MLIYNAEVYSMTEDMHFYGYVEVQGGKITAVEQGKPETVTPEAGASVPVLRKV